MNFRNGLLKAACVFLGIILLFAFMLIGLSSCGNRAILDPGNFNFTHIHITDYQECHCFDISKWWDNDNGIEVRLINGEGIFCSEGTYQLFEHSTDCPYCN